MRRANPFRRRSALLVPIAALLLLGLRSVQPTVPRWVAIETLRLGEARGPDFAFFRIGAMAVGPRGEIAVRRHAERRVDVFDSTGRPLARIGRAGDGPGDFRFIDRIDWINDTLIVHDAALERFTILTAAGRLVRTSADHLTPRGSGNRALEDLAPLNNGTRIGPASGGSAWIPLVRTDGAGRDLGTLDSLRRGGPTGIPLGAPGTPGSRSIFEFQPFRDGSLWAAHRSGDGVVVAHRAPAAAPGDSVSFRILGYSADGRLRFDRRFRYDALPIPSRVADSLARVARDLVLLDRAHSNPPACGPGVLPPCAAYPDVPPVEVMRRGLSVPPTRPPITALVSGRDGTVWLRREELRPDSVRWQVLDTRGQMVGELLLPTSLTVFDADRSHVWGVQRMAYDVEEIVRLRVHSRDAR